MRQLTLALCFGLLSSCQNKTEFQAPPGQDQFKFGVKYNNQVDIVLIVDNSSSMQKYQENLVVQMPRFIERLNGLKMDYRIAVITSSLQPANDGGDFIGDPAYVTHQDKDIVSHLQDRILFSKNGSALSAPLKNFLNIFESETLKERAPDFLRPEALFVLITLSDDNDRSTITPEEFIKRVDVIKPKFRDGGRSWFYNYVGVLSKDSPCENLHGILTPGVDHVYLSQTTKGVMDEICANTLERAVNNIRSRIVERVTDYKLEQKPKVETIKVYLEDKLIDQSDENGWSYIQEGNLVRFHGSAIPSSELRVRVDYERVDAN